MIGVAQKKNISLVADVLAALDHVEHAFVFHCQGLDELCCVAPMEMIEISNKQTQVFTLDAMDYGLSRCSLADLQGGTAEQNADILRATLHGDHTSVADTLILNAGVANYLYGISNDIASGIALAKQHQQQGSALQVLP